MIVVANTSYLLDPNLEQDSNTIQPIKCLLTRHFILKQGASMSKIEWVIMSLSKINIIIHNLCYFLNSIQNCYYHLNYAHWEGGH